MASRSRPRITIARWSSRDWKPRRRSADLRFWRTALRGLGLEIHIHMDAGRARAIGDDAASEPCPRCDIAAGPHDAVVKLGPGKQRAIAVQRGMRGEILGACAEV